MANDYYKELAYDIFANTESSMALAEEIVKWLKGEGLLDYDSVKEYYTDE